MNVHIVTKYVMLVKHLRRLASESITHIPSWSKAATDTVMIEFA